jgi:hypothetical protein
VLEVPEYDPKNPDTLTVLREDDVISPSEAAWFREQLKQIAGTTLTGQPRLRMVWGPTHLDPMATDPNQLKYLDDLSTNLLPLGERRWVIEIHRSPEFLAASQRYLTETRQDADGTKLLKSLPSEGVYDYWIRLERRDFSYHPPDNEALEAIKLLWAYENSDQKKADALVKADMEIERRRAIWEQRGGRGQIQTSLVLPA